MQIAYDLTPEDLVALHTAHLARSPAFGRQLAILRWACAGLALVGVVAVGALAGGGHLATWIAGGAAGALVGFWAFPRWFKGAALARAKRRYEGERGRSLCGRQHLSIEEAGLRARSETEEHLAPWAQVWEVARTPDRVFVYLGPTRAHVIPICRVVGGDLLAFLDELESRAGAQGRAAAKEAS